MSRSDDGWDNPEDRESGYLAHLQHEQIAFSKSLRGIKDGKDSQLYLDRRTGRLVVAQDGADMPNDVIPATKMAKEGFFLGGR